MIFQREREEEERGRERILLYTKNAFSLATIVASVFINIQEIGGIFSVN